MIRGWLIKGKAKELLKGYPIVDLVLKLGI